MCLEVHSTHHLESTAALDTTQWRMLVAGNLDRPQQMALVRYLLGAAGVDQPDDPDLARCVCGSPIELEPPRLAPAT